GVHCRVPHGLACAVMLPAALRVNRDVRGADIAEIARVVGQREFSSEGDAVEFLIDKVESVCEAVGIPKRLRDIGVEEHQIADLVPSSRGNSMSANPRTLADDELREVLEDLW
ncbi:MAG: iron-containing alcohol dehydrogenase, partial [Planctomycetota bacterium]